MIDLKFDGGKIKLSDLEFLRNYSESEVVRLNDQLATGLSGHPIPDENCLRCAMSNAVDAWIRNNCDPAKIQQAREMLAAKGASV